MKPADKAKGAAFALLLIAAGTGWWLTKPLSPDAVQKRAAAVTSAALVDESTYTTALRVARLAKTPEEQPYSLTALRVADHELALAFTAALRDVEAHPPALSPEARAIQDRLVKSQVLLDSDQQRVTQLSAALAAASESQRDALRDELELAQSQLDLDKDEVEEANQDLVAAGGNPQQRIEAMIQEHDAQVKARAAAATAAATPVAIGVLEKAGSLKEFREWLELRQERQQLADAADLARQKARGLERAALCARGEPGGNQGRNRRARSPHEERQSRRQAGQSRAARGAQP